MHKLRVQLTKEKHTKTPFIFVAAVWKPPAETALLGPKLEGTRQRLSPVLPKHTKALKMSGAPSAAKSEHKII